MGKPRKAKSQPQKSTGAEYRFVIDAYSPETMPMARLAEYITELAAILGEPKSVHFLRVDEGSTVPVLKIEREALPKVRERAIAVRRGEAPRDAQVAYKTVNKLLREDNAIAVLKERKSTPILTFPGREEAEEKFPAVRQHGSIDGVIVRVGGVDETVPVILQSEGQQIVGCNANRQVAKQLATRLFEAVRLYGNGKWRRDAEGIWTLEYFKIESFEALQNAPLSVALEKIRAIGGEWAAHAYDELEVIRYGAKGSGNGGH